MKNLLFDLINYQNEINIKLLVKQQILKAIDNLDIKIE